MPLDAPVTIATLLNSLLIFIIVLDPTPHTRRCELLLAPMKISIYAPYAKERFEIARQQSIQHSRFRAGNSQISFLQRSPIRLATHANRDFLYAPILFPSSAVLTHPR